VPVESIPIMGSAMSLSLVCMKKKTLSYPVSDTHVLILCVCRGTNDNVLLNIMFCFLRF
jgi:hypothetical protein